MSNILAAFANSYNNGEKLRPDLATTYQETAPQPDYGFSYGGQAMGQTAAQAPAPTPYTQEQANAYIAANPPAAAPTPALPAGGFVIGGTDQNTKDQYGFSQKQYGDIKASWDAVKTDPKQMMQLMRDYGVDASALSRATGVSYDEIGNYLKTNGAENGFGGYSWQTPQSPTSPASGATGSGLINSNSPTRTTTTTSGGASVSTVDAGETIEGRLGGLLGTDQFGNYTNQVVRQASERAMQAFAGRGLLNSSMAVQAAQEAAIAKAIEIAGPDAKTFFEQGRANQDATNQFALQDKEFGQADKQFGQSLEKIRLEADLAIERMRTEVGLNGTETDKAAVNALRQNYITSVERANTNYTEQAKYINNSAMSPAEKQAALNAAAKDRDSELAFNNRMYASMPNWKSEWGAIAVPTQGVDLNTVSDIATLSNIADDPAQPAATREAAKARIASLQTTPTPVAPAPAPAPVAVNDRVGD